MARENENEPVPTPVIDRTPLSRAYLTGIMFALGALTVGGVVKLTTWAFRPGDHKALGEGE